jgi:hypothetical protein
LELSEVEEKARQFIKQRHPRLELIFFRTVYKEGDAWMVDGEVKFKRAYFFHTTRTFKIKIDAITGKAISYEETKAPQNFVFIIYS